MRTLGAVALLIAIMLPWQAAAQQPCPTLVVSNNNDVVNGDTSSPCALIASPGADGISLREAVEAADNATGAGTITITFAPSLAGQTITPGSTNDCCYVITRDSVAIVGLTGTNGAPTVTVDATNMSILFSVTASSFTLKSMQIINMGAASPGVMTGVYVRAGETAAQGQTVNPGDELQVSNTVIEDNIFSNTPGQATIVFGVVVGAAFPNTASNAVFSGAIIANNTFTFTALSSGGTTEAVKLQAQGTSSTVQNVSILNNTITAVEYGIEIVPASPSNGGRILNTYIAANSFSGNIPNLQTPILIDPSGDDGQPCTGNTVNGTVIEGNIMTGVSGPAIMLMGGVGNGSTVSATGNAITNTTIVNNLITGDTTFGEISISGGREESSQNNVTNVSIVNNTIANYSGPPGNGGAIDVNNNLSGGTNNTVTGVSVLNTILWNNTSDFTGANAVTPSQVTTSITAQAGFAGVNGNIDANPLFVNASNNFELQSGSPAHGAGTHAGAPAIDIDCQFRASPPSIGAYEFEGPNVCNNSAGTSPLLAAVLPESRSAQVNGTVTAFATIINTGTATATGCSIYPLTNLPGTFVYQTTNPATNAVTGTANTPVSIAGNDTPQSFVFAVTPSAAFSPNDLLLNFGCSNVPPAPINVGLDTLLLSASTTPTPDVIALGATLQNDGIVHVTNGSPPTGVFAVATDNLGSSDTITVATNTGGVSLPLTITLCQTDPTTGACMQTPAATVATTISSNATPTFGIFVSASGTVAFDPANNRIFVTFTDSTAAIRGETSVAVETQ
jgi:hypothetical protein